MDAPNLYESGNRFVNGSQNDTSSALKSKNLELCSQLGRTKIGSRSGSALPADTSNLNSPEISINLQQLIQSEVESNNNATPVGGNQLALDDSVSLFTDLLTESRATTSRVPLGAQSQQVVRRSQTQQNIDANPNVSNNHQHFNPFTLPESQSCVPRDAFRTEYTAIKQEPIDDQGDYSSSCSRSSTYSPGPIGQRCMGFGPSSPSFSNDKSLHGLGKSKMGKKNLDKGSDEYKKRRERNNIAVRKSREKAKQRSRDTEKKVSELQKANDSLHHEIDMLQKELDVVKSMLNQAGIHPNTIENEVQKCLGEYRHRFGVLNKNA